ncbi:hypothetical protein FA013_01450 [Raoultella planticola]|nr:hypothetical protein FA013_01450 [Raoultella planticola]
MAGALRALAERALTLMAQARDICFMMVQNRRGIGYRGDGFLHNKAAHCGELHWSHALCYLA